MTNALTPMHSRRQLIAGAVSLSALTAAVAPADGQSTTSPKTIVSTKAIHQEIDFKCDAHRVYEALLDSKQFTASAGGRKAEIHREVGGVFSVFDGHIVGRILELVPDRLVVQSWRVVTWPEGIHSVARFKLTAKPSGALITFDHTGFPSELAEHLESGWNENYWTALQKYLT